MRRIIFAISLTFSTSICFAQMNNTINYYEEFKTEFEQAKYAPQLPDFIDENTPSKSLQCFEAFESSPNELNASRFTLYDLGPSSQNDHEYRIEPGNGSGHEPNRPFANWSANRKTMWNLHQKKDSFVIELDPVIYRKYYPFLPQDRQVDLMWNTIKKSHNGKLYYNEIWKTPFGRLISIRYGMCEKTLSP